LLFGEEGIEAANDIFADALHGSRAIKDDANVAALAHGVLLSD
jgi:hypothetical protein